MDKLINQIKQYYPSQILAIHQVGLVEFNVVLNPQVQSSTFSQDLKDHIISLMDEWSILQINILDKDGNLKDSFATNQ